MTPTSPATAPESLEQRISRLLARWREETQYLSSTTQIQAPGLPGDHRAGVAALPFLRATWSRRTTGTCPGRCCHHRLESCTSGSSRQDQTGCRSVASLGQGKRSGVVMALEIVFPGLAGSATASRAPRRTPTTALPGQLVRSTPGGGRVPTLTMVARTGPRPCHGRKP
jgi:hypothetical protein